MNQEESDDKHLLITDEFENHMDDDIELLKKWGHIAYKGFIEIIRQIILYCESYKTKNPRQFYTLLFLGILLVVNKQLQSNENKRLLQQVNYLKHQILIHNLHLNSDQNVINRTLHHDIVSNSDLFKLVNTNEFGQEKNSFFNALISFNDEVFLLNRDELDKKSNKVAKHVTTKQDEKNSDTSHMKFNAEFLMDTAKFHTGLSVFNFTSVDQLNDLKSTMNLKFANSPHEYKLDVYFSLNRVN